MASMSRYVRVAVAIAGIAAGCKESTAPVPVASVVVAPDSSNVIIGSTLQLTASVFDSSSHALEGRKVQWSSSDISIGTVSQTGLVAIVRTGRVVITATAGGKSGTAVIIGRTAGPDYAIFDAQFTQATQSSDASIPMVLGVNGAQVNVLVTADQGMSPAMSIVLRLFDASGTLYRADTVNLPPGLSAGASYAAPTVKFLLPPTALVPGMRWQVVRDPQHVASDGNPANDAFPRTGPGFVSTALVPTLRMKFVPIVLTAHNNTTGNVSAANIPQYLRTLESVYPIANIEATVGAPFTTAISFGTPPTGGGDFAAFWSPVLAQLDDARMLDPDPSVYWVGVVLPPAGFTLTLTGGIGYVVGSGTSFGARTRTTLVTSLGWASNPAFTRETVAHELGHNFGRNHAPCSEPDQGFPTGIDPFYPYPGGKIGVTGWDVRGWVAGRSTSPTIHPTSDGDIMGYCNSNWVSDYTYRAVLLFRGSVAAARQAEAAWRATTRQRVLVIRGAVDNAKGVTLEPVFATDARPTAPERSGGYVLEGRDANGDVLFTRTFAPSVIDHVLTRHFAFAIPVSAEMEERLVSIEVRGAVGRARLNRNNGTTNSGTTNGGTTSGGTTNGGTTNGGTTNSERAGVLVRVSCADPTSRGVMVREEVSGALLGMTNAASTLVAAAPGTLLSVTCSDGLRSSRASVVAR